jgi:hypothetical protein
MQLNSNSLEDPGEDHAIHQTLEWDSEGCRVDEDVVIQVVALQHACVRTRSSIGVGSRVEEDGTRDQISGCM